MLALFGDAEGGLPPTQRSAARHPAARPAGLGQDDDVGEARDGGWRSRAGIRCWSRPTSGGRRRSSSCRSSASRPACGSTIRRASSIRCARASGALAEAKNSGFDIVIVDTAGRLHIDDELMDGAARRSRRAVEPTDLLYVADAMTGQDAIKSAGEFNRRDRRHRRRADEDGRRCARRRGAVGGLASSACRSRLSAAASGCRISSRSIPIASCRACSAWATCCRSSRRPKQAIDRRGRGAKLEEKLRLDEFTLEDFRDQLRTIKKMGPLEQILGMLPGMGDDQGAARQREQIDEKQLDRVEAIINSMTAERAAESPDHQRQPPQADREGQRDVGRGGEPAAEAVRADEEDAEGDRRHGGGWRARKGRPRHDEGADAVDEISAAASATAETRAEAGAER